MDIKNLLKLFITLIIFGFIIISSCERPEINIRKCERNFQFSLPITITPQKDTFEIGDTFFIEYKTPTKMYNLQEHNYIELKDFGFKILIDLYRITKSDSNRIVNIHAPGYQNSLEIGVGNSFTIDSIKGGISPIGDFSIVLKNTMYQDTFFHKSGIIMQDTGLFYFQFNDAFYYYVSQRHLKVVESDCDQRWYPFSYTINKGNTHIELLENMGIHAHVSAFITGEIEKHNFEQGSWNFVVVPKSTP